MDSDSLRSLIEAFDPELPIERAWSPPAAWFTAPEVLQLEQREVFARSWQPVARLDQLARPGDYVAGCRGRDPYVVLRGEDGELRAFHNTCRHKGREVAQGSGNARELVCNYHGWSYGQDGRLKSAPRMGGIEDFEREQMSLPPMAHETWGPWVFVHGDPAPRPLAEEVAPLTALLDPTGWERLRYVTSTTWEVASNWKVVVDNYLDGGYHIPLMHPTLDAQIDMESYRTELFERSSLQTTRPATLAPEGLNFDAARRLEGGALYLWLFPNFMLNRYGPCLDSNLVIPDGPDRCRVLYDYFFIDDGSADAEAFVAESIAQSEVTQREDSSICESVQLGLLAESYDRGRYAPRVEHGEYHFHRLLAERLRGAVGAD